jgi:micrococcal nuclease
METLLAFIMMLFAQLFGADVPVQVVPDTSAPAAVEVVAVVDGDTIKVLIDGVEERVRYIGIDTPESYGTGAPECYSQEASARNRTLVDGKQVTLVADAEDRDKYERLLRYVYVDGVLVNEVLVQEGFATTMTIEPNTGKQQLFVDTEAAARLAGAGLWSACTADAQSAVATTSELAQELELELEPEPEPEPEPELTVTAANLSPGQQRLLETLGLDAAVLTVTAEMIACAEGVVGAERITAMTAGELPSFMEGVRLVGCYRQ